MASKKFLFLTAIIFMFFGIKAQQINVKSFRDLPNDIDARHNYHKSNICLLDNS